MKTYLTYGFASALATMLFSLVLYFAGLHSDISKLGTAQLVGTLGIIAIAILCIVLGTQAKRATVPPGEDFGYGRALGAGIMITLFAALFGIVTTYLYMQVINPEMKELIIQSQTQKFEAKGMNADAIEKMETITRKFMTPPIMAAVGFIQAMLGGTVISLITAAFLKRSANDGPPLVA